MAEAKRIVVGGTLIDGDNNVVPIVPNSFEFNPGNPERSVLPQVTGNGDVENVVSEDYTTAKSDFKFMLYATDENIERVLKYKDNFSNNAFKFISEDNVTYLFKNAVLVNNPNITVSTDGEISPEFQSKPFIRS